MVLSEEIKTVLDLLKNPEMSKDVLHDAFQAVSRKILQQYPSNDLKVEVEVLLESFQEKVPFVDEMRDFLNKMFKIAAHREKGLPLGVADRKQLQSLRDDIMSALEYGADTFHKMHPDRERPYVADTEVFITGSRARGYSFDLKRSFAPGCDVDVLLVGDGIFKGEADFIGAKIEEMESKGRSAGRLKKYLEKSLSKGFFEGYDKRFVPPKLGALAKNIREEIIQVNDSVFGGSGEVALVNFHIGRSDSKIVRAALADAVKCA